MAALLYFLLTIVLLVLFIRLWRMRRKSERRTAGLLSLQMVIFTLFYGSLVFTLGGVVEAGDLLRRLHMGRYLLFAIFIPLLTITGLEFAMQAGVVWAQKRVFQVVIWLGAVLMLGAAGVIEWQLKDDLVADELLGTIRYVHEGSLPSFMPVLTALVLSILGVLIWRKIKWPWVLVGGLVMLLGSLFPWGEVGPLVSSWTMGILLGMLVATEQRLLTPDYSLTESELDSRIRQVAVGRSKKS